MSCRLICCTLPRAVGTFLQQHCVDCHRGESAEAGLWLDELATQQLNANSLTAWVKVHDKLQAGEMPPAEMPQPEPAQSSAVLTELAPRLQTVSAAQQAAEWRVALRRLNRVEYGNTLRDLLSLPQLDVKDMLPADGQAHGFEKAGAALNLSYVQMPRYLEAANAALEEALVLGPRPESGKQRFPAQLKIIETAQTNVFAELLGELKGVAEGGETLLDRTMVLYGSNLGNANSHDNRNMPVILAGGGFRHGRHLAFDRTNNYPLPNLYVSMLQRLGIETDRFASATGTMRGLEPL